MRQNDYISYSFVSFCLDYCFRALKLTLPTLQNLTVVLKERARELWNLTFDTVEVLNSNSKVMDRIFLTYSQFVEISSLTEKWRHLVSSIVQDGDLYGNSSLRRILQVTRDSFLSRSNINSVNRDKPKCKNLV